MCDHLPQATNYHFETPLIFPVKALYLEPLVNNHLSWATATTFWPNNFTVFNGTDLTSSKRPLNEWYGFLDRCMYYTIQNIQRIFGDNTYK